MRKKRSKAPADEAMFVEPPAARITPEDIQGKEFGVARLGGYRMHEVDEFLDEVTAALGELIEENERLRGAAGGRGAPPPPPAAAPRTAIQPFLDREREFLRSLGTLVQGHMEGVREMARSMPAADSLGGVGEPASDAEPAESTDREPGGEPAEATGSLSEAVPAEAPAAAPAESIAATPSTEPEEEAASARPTEPIRVEEPQPARAGGDEGGLRELFWGEDE